MRTTEQEIAEARRLEMLAQQHRARALKRQHQCQAVLAELFADHDTLPLQQVLQAFRNRGLVDVAITTTRANPRPRASGPLVAAREALGIGSYRLPAEPTGPYASYSGPRGGLQLWSRRTYPELSREHLQRISLT